MLSGVWCVHVGGHTCIWDKSKRQFGLHQQTVSVVCCRTSLHYHTWGNAAPPGQQEEEMSLLINNLTFVLHTCSGELELNNNL